MTHLLKKSDQETFGLESRRLADDLNLVDSDVPTTVLVNDCLVVWISLASDVAGTPTRTLAHVEWTPIWP